MMYKNHDKYAEAPFTLVFMQYIGSQYALIPIKVLGLQILQLHSYFVKYEKPTCVGEYNIEENPKP